MKKSNKGEIQLYQNLFDQIMSFSIDAISKSIVATIKNEAKNVIFCLEVRHRVARVPNAYVQHLYSLLTWLIMLLKQSPSRSIQFDPPDTLKFVCNSITLLRKFVTLMTLVSKLMHRDGNWKPCSVIYFFSIKLIRPTPDGDVRNENKSDD